MISKTRKKGFTLAEMLIALTFLGIILPLIYRLYLGIFDVKNSEYNRSQLRYEVAEAMYRITEDLIPAKGEGLNITDNKQLRFWVDHNGNNTEEPSNEVYLYTWSGSPLDPLMRSYNGKTQELLPNTIEFFVNLEGDNRITIVMEAENNGQTFRLTSAIKPRNLF